MELIPLQAIPAQNVETTLANQSVILRVYQLRYGMFIDVTVTGVLEVGAVICNNTTLIIRNTYLNRNVGFEGDFVFQDTQGNTNPIFPGLGTRYQLLYLSPDDLTSFGVADT